MGKGTTEVTVPEAYELQATYALKQDDPMFGGMNPLDAKIPARRGSEDISIIDAPLSPLALTVVKAEGEMMMKDADPNRKGVQVVLNIDISDEGLKEGDVNGYQNTYLKMQSTIRQKN